MHGTGLLLLGLVAGYWVLERAEANKGNLKRVGRVIGWLVITASFVSLVCRVFSLATGTSCPFEGKDWRGKGGEWYHKSPAPAP